MNLPKVFFVFALLLFACIGITALTKGSKQESAEQLLTFSKAMEVPLEEELRSVTAAVDDPNSDNITEVLFQQQHQVEEQLPEADRIADLFRKVDPKLSIVETVTYKSRVPWLPGRAAWVADYASHFKTSRHFIARSLNGKRDYFKQDVAVGDRFNVLRSDRDIRFHLVIDVTRSKMWFYCHCGDNDERILLKTYPVGLGRVDSSQPSGLLTPLGTYTLGEKVAIHKAKQMGQYNNQKVEMIRIFGTRWIPFAEEVVGCTALAKGFGIHGVPWCEGTSGELIEDRACIGKHEGDGCIRLLSEDIEELFSIIITKPTTVQLVKNFFDAQLPGHE